MTSTNKSFLTLDTIISRLIPIIGAILFIVGLWYLIYTSVWQWFTVPIRLGLGFFASLLIVGGWFSFSNKLQYFADIVIWWGILLLYGTLMYGSRATEISQAFIPEIATIITAFVFILVVGYFASLRRSGTILVLGALGAYLTPFILGQHDVWSSNLSFNAYLIYFAAIGMTIFLLSREISAYKLIPLNLFWLYLGTTILHYLTFADSPTNGGFFVSEIFTLFLMIVIMAMSIWSISLTSRYFSEKNQETIVSIWYMLPLMWVYIEIVQILNLHPFIKASAFFVIALIYFVGWFLVRSREYVRYQHIILYAGGMISIIFMATQLLHDIAFLISILVAYGSLVFMWLYILDPEPKWERLVSAMIFGWFGAIVSFYYAEWISMSYRPLYSIFACIPSTILYPISRFHKNTPQSVSRFLKKYSILFGVIIASIFFGEYSLAIDFSLLFLILPWAIFVITSYRNKNLKTKKKQVTIWIILVSIGFFTTFFYLLRASLDFYHTNGQYFLRKGGIFHDIYFLKSIVTVIIYFLAMYTIRMIKKVEKNTKSSFTIVAISYVSLLFFVNYIIILILNDLEIDALMRGARTILITFWWIALSISMIMMGIFRWQEYREEKFIGLLLLFLTITKIGFYDLSAMDMNKKIIVLMMVGGIMMMFSYFLHTKWYLTDSTKSDKQT